MIAKVKRCPWCNGHTLILKRSQIVSFIECLECQATGPIGRNDERSVRLWNAEERDMNQSALVLNRKSNRHDLKEVDLG